MHKLQNSIDFLEYLRINATMVRAVVTQEEDEIGV
jgi:hypothetical protein